ncbi:MAG: type ISP restriction/modification enzyme, partial [Ferruginibacter sp.]
KRIKDTFIKNSTAQKTKLYDMYSRFYRWAMDRLNENGVIAFISNRSFIDSRTFDGFRKTIQQEFDYAYIIDTKSDVRANPKIAGTTHNVFGIQTGVAVLFLVKTSHKQIKTTPCKIEYITMDDFWRKKEKLAWFSEHGLQTLDFENITPDKNNNWINNADNDWDSLIPLADKNVKANKGFEAIFKSFTNGVITARDYWVYDLKESDLLKKVTFLLQIYKDSLAEIKGISSKSEIKSKVDYSIKWSRAVLKDLSKQKEFDISSGIIVDAIYRPFIKKKLYYSKQLNEMLYQIPQFFGSKGNLKNKTIGFSSGSARVDFSIYAGDLIPDYAFYSLDQAQFLPLYAYDLNYSQSYNITNWSLELFQNNYTDKTISKESIFHYVYAVLHNPAYRKKYELNLKREFPRIPLYDHFSSWVKWEEQLMNLHINYETVKAYPLKIITTDVSSANGAALEKLPLPRNLILTSSLITKNR